MAKNIDMIEKPIWLDSNSPPGLFPSSDAALDEPNGLLAAGGDLSVPRLRAAYRQGIFPWYSEGQPILWWSPDPRTVIFPEQFHVSRSLAREIRKRTFDLTVNTAFDQVIKCCAEPREQQPDTWITHEMQQAYIRLHQAGHAHSVECWHNDSLVGGLYGVVSGQVFFGESMFSRMSNASKVALACLAEMGFAMIDCQMETEHLTSLGAIPIPRSSYLALLDKWCEQPELQPQIPGTWPS